MSREFSLTARRQRGIEPVWLPTLTAALRDLDLRLDCGRRVSQSPPSTCDSGAPWTFVADLAEEIDGGLVVVEKRSAGPLGRLGRSAVLVTPCAVERSPTRAGDDPSLVVTGSAGVAISTARRQRGTVIGGPLAGSAPSLRATGRIHTRRQRHDLCAGLRQDEEQSRTAQGVQMPVNTKPRPIGRIVVGVDGSESSAAALAWAIEMARGMHAEIVAVYGLDGVRVASTGAP